MKNSPELFELIQSLSPSEKRYISVNISSQTDTPAYYKLFRMLQTFDEYDEKKVYEMAKKESFAQRLPEMKYYLHRLILKSIRNFNSGSTVEAGVYESLIEVDILYRKKLTEQANKLLRKVEKEAEEKEMFEVLNLCYIWERELQLDQLYTKSKTELASFYQRQRALNKKIENLNDYRYLKDQLRKFNYKKGEIRSNADVAWVKQFLSHPLLRQKKTLSDSAASIYHHLRALCLYLLGDYKKAFTDLNSDIASQEKRAMNDGAALLGYINACSNKISLCIHLRNYDEAMQALNTIKNIPGKAREERWKYKLTETQLLDLQNRSYHTEFRIYLAFGKYQNGMQCISGMEKLLKKSSYKPNGKHLLTFNYYCAYNFFITGDYRRSLEYLRGILNYRASDTLLREDIYCYSQLLYLIIHYELGTEALPSYLLKSTYRFLAKRNRIYKVENAILSFIRNKLLKSINPHLITKNFAELKSRLEEITRDPYEQKILDYFDIISWLDSKVSRRPFFEVMKEKHAR